MTPSSDAEMTERKEFEAWKASLPAGQGYSAFDAWQAAKAQERQRSERLLAVLRRLAFVPAVVQVLGKVHSDDCKCPLCEARDLIADHDSQALSGDTQKEG